MESVEDAVAAEPAEAAVVTDLAVVPSDGDGAVNWAEEMEQQHEGGVDEEEKIDLPEPVVTFDEKLGIKTVITYRINDEGQKVKTTRTFLLQTMRLTKLVAERKRWRKFGDAVGDGPGLSATTTFVPPMGDVKMEFMKPEFLLVESDKPKDAEKKAEKQRSSEETRSAKTTSQEQLKPADATPSDRIFCRICGDNHWTMRCPLKDLRPEGSPEPSSREAASRSQATDSHGKYVPPNRRNGGDFGVRVTNLSADTSEDDLRELFKPFGEKLITRVYMGRDRKTGVGRGFAFVHFSDSEAARRAIEGVNGHGYDHLILRCELAETR